MFCESTVVGTIDVCAESIESTWVTFQDVAARGAFCGL